MLGFEDFPAERLEAVVDVPAGGLLLGLELFLELLDACLDLLFAGTLLRGRARRAEFASALGAVPGDRSCVVLDLEHLPAGLALEDHGASSKGWSCGCESINGSVLRQRVYRFASAVWYFVTMSKACSM